jgi:biotin carboxylase
LLHVASRDHDPYFYRGFNIDIYTKSITHVDLVTTLAELEAFKPDYVFAGFEAGVHLADLLNHHLKLAYSNEFDTTDCRRNKYKMIEKLHEKKIAAAEQMMAQDWPVLASWLNARQCFPVVLKPLHSAGSDGVYVCANVNECQRAFGLIKGKMNKLNLLNDFVLAQEFLDGTEYVVNTVSRNEEVLLTELVQYKKKILPTGSIVYDVDMLLSPESKVADELFSYVKQVHQALGIRNGSAHAEVMMTKTGPKLVEIASRTDGILRPDVCEKTTTFGQLKALALSMTDP